MSDTINKTLEWCFKKSIWVYHVNAGGCNGCDIEILDALTPYYDVERFGIKLVHTPAMRTRCLWPVRSPVRCGKGSCAFMMQPPIPNWLLR